MPSATPCCGSGTTPRRPAADGAQGAAQDATIDGGPAQGAAYAASAQPLTLPALLAAQAARTPDAVAVMFEERRLSYAELEAHANALAHHLRGLGVGPETVVGLMLERSPEMVIGLLGILKAGGAYLPLDPNYPAERLAFMLADAGAAVLVTQDALTIGCRRRWCRHHPGRLDADAGDCAAARQRARARSRSAPPRPT